MKQSDTTFFILLRGWPRIKHTPLRLSLHPPAGVCMLNRTSRGLTHGLRGCFNPVTTYRLGLYGIDYAEACGYCRTVPVKLFKKMIALTIDSCCSFKYWFVTVLQCGFVTMLIYYSVTLLLICKCIQFTNRLYIEHASNTFACKGADRPLSKVQEAGVHRWRSYTWSAEAQPGDAGSRLLCRLSFAP